MKMIFADDIGPPARESWAILHLSAVAKDRYRIEKFRFPNRNIAGSRQPKTNDGNA